MTISPLNVIPSTTENYISVSKKLANGIELRFLDSYWLLPSKFEELVKNLNLNDFYFTCRAFPDNIQFKLVRKKGVFPYDYVNTWNVSEENQFLSIETFYSKIKREHILSEDYENAKAVWNTSISLPDLYMKINALRHFFRVIVTTRLHFTRFQDCHMPQL